MSTNLITIAMKLDDRNRVFLVNSDQAKGVVDVLDFLAADPAHRVSGYVVGWRAIPKEVGSK